MADNDDVVPLWLRRNPKHSALQEHAAVKGSNGEVAAKRLSGGSQLARSLYGSSANTAHARLSAGITRVSVMLRR